MLNTDKGIRDLLATVGLPATYGNPCDQGLSRLALTQEAAFGDLFPECSLRERDLQSDFRQSISGFVFNLRGGPRVARKPGSFFAN
jgi:hypothetical protein